ncbi:MAG: bifunctional hydroxymethylpyrimidine kinase/phosphomethylpyrimidine kinase [Acetilactobacillus jinshanensis]
MINRFPQAVTIAGSDSDGSAGMQADLETFEHYHVYGASIITACVAGNSYGIHESVVMPLSFIDQEFKDLADDFNVRAAKTGMLADSKLIDDVVKNYQKADFGPLVVDPVIVTKHGAMLLKASAFNTLKQKLIPLATVITPNYYEAQKLAQMPIKTDPDMLTAAQKLIKMGAKNVMIKGKHNDPVNQKKVRDLVLLADGHHFWLSGPYYDTKRKNGTGDTLSAGITAGLAKGLSVKDSIVKARQYVERAIHQSLNIAHVYGPINHFAK